MPIQKSPITVACDVGVEVMPELEPCGASYVEEDGMPRIRPGWRHLRIRGEQVVICPRHDVEHVVVEGPEDSAAAMDSSLYEEALGLARRAGRRPSRADDGPA